MKYPRLSSLAISMAGLFCAANAVAQTQPTLTVYGVIDVGLVKQNHPDVGIPVLVGTALSKLTLPAPFADGVGYGSALGGNGLKKGAGLHVAQGARSRLGFKGTEPLGSGLTARFEVEHRFYPDTGGLNQDEPGVFWDKAIVGLASSTWGDLALGRDYMPGFYPQYLMDPWLNEGVAQMGANLYAFSGYINERTRFARYNNGVYYRAKQGNFAGVLGMALKEDTGAGAVRNFKNRWGFSALYTAGPWLAGVGYDTSEVLQDQAKEDLWFAGVSYDAGFIKPRLSYSRASLKAVGTFAALGNPINQPFTGGMGKRALQPSSWTLAATAPTTNGMVKMGITRLQWDDAGTNRAETVQQKCSLGYEHTLSKRTALYADFTRGRTTHLPSLHAWDMGIKHKF